MHKKLYLMSAASAAMLSCLIPPQAALASNMSDSTNTDVQLLNYIQEEKNYARTHRPNPELIKLRQQINEEKFIRPLNPAYPAPIVFEGDDLSYDTNTGAVLAKGKVRVTHDYSRLYAQDVSGNTKKGYVEIPGKVHVAQCMPQMIADGRAASYNYNEKEGQIKDVKGFIGNQHFKGEQANFYPTETIIYNGYVTRCPAKKPDYRLSADKIEIYPDSHLVAYNAKFWIKNVVVYQKKRYIAPIGKAAIGSKSAIPVHLNFNSNDGMQIRYEYSHNISKNIDSYVHFNYYTKRDLRNVYGVVWHDKAYSLRTEYGYYEDNNDNWIKKIPTAIFSYQMPIPKSPFDFTYSLEYERWKNGEISSWHRENAIDLTRRPLKLSKASTLYSDVGYSWTHESYNESMQRNFHYDLSLVSNINAKMAGYMAYHYSRSTTANSLFDFGLDNYSKKVTAGLSYQLTPKDRIVIANEFDAGDAMRTKDRDYYWYHDFHCFDMMVRYREKRHSWHVKFGLVHW